jgi:hypothetical protein
MSVGRRQRQGSMRPVAIVVLHEDSKDPLEMVLVEDQQPVEYSERAVRPNRSATPFACGVPNGVRRIWILCLIVLLDQIRE